MTKKKQIIHIDSLVKSMNVVILPEIIEKLSEQLNKIMITSINNAIDNARSTRKTQ